MIVDVRSGLYGKYTFLAYISVALADNFTGEQKERVNAWLISLMSCGHGTGLLLQSLLLNIHLYRVDYIIGTYSLHFLSRFRFGSDSLKIQ